MSKRFSIILIVLIVAVIVLGIIWQQGKELRLKPQEVKIAMLGPLTGGVSKYGVEARNGAQLAISQLNQKQSKYRYILQVMDDGADPSLAEAQAQDLVARKEILAVVGSVTTPTTLSAGKIFQEQGLPTVSPSATGPAVSQLGDFIFRVCPSDTYQGRALAEYVVQEADFYKIAILWDEKNASYSGALADSFSQRAEQLGAKIVGRRAYQEGQEEFSSLLQTLKATEPEVLFIPGYYTEAALIAQEIRAMDWDIPIIGGDGFHASDLIEIGGKAVDGVRFTTFFVSTSPDPKVKEFVAAYQNRFGSEPGWIAAHGYDAMQVIAQAIEKEGANREAIQKGLTEIEGFPGVSGTISFDENGDVIKEILRLEIKEGKFQLSGIYK